MIVSTTNQLQPRIRLAIFLFLILPYQSLLAHAPQENYIWLNLTSDAVVGRVELNVNDVRDKLNIDLDDQGENRLESLLKERNSLQSFIRENFTMSDAQGEIPYVFGKPSLFAEGNDYLQFPYRTERLPASSEITIRNSIFLVPPYSDQDRFHRSMIVAEFNELSDQEFGDGNVALIFTPNRHVQTIDLNNPGKILNWKDFVWQGMLHIGIGLDHILFIAVLLLSAVMTRRDRRWVPVESFKSALWNTMKIVTIFTIAHSITLSLAALDFVNLPGPLVETIIAISIIAIALNNIFPRFSSHSWVLVFVFGLFHGLGFASVMGDLQFRVGFLERILLMFNVGVEIGQLLIVLVLLPMLFFLRKKSLYRPVVLVGVSTLSILVSVWWVAERTGLVA